MKTKVFFVLLAIGVGFWIAYSAYSPAIACVVGLSSGVIALLAVLAVESQVREFTPKKVMGGAMGIGIASLAFFAFEEFVDILNVPSYIAPYLLVVVFLLLFYFGITIGLRKGREADLTGKKS